MYTVVTGPELTPLRFTVKEKDKHPMNSNPPFVLLIEDDLATAELYSQAIGDEHTVLVCDTEDQVAEAIQNHRILAVILEPAFLGGRGWAMIPFIQRKLTPCSVPLILCSTLDDRKRGLEMGAAAFLVKPILPATLLDVLHRVTARA